MSAKQIIDRLRADLAVAVRRRLQNLGWSQQELSRRAGVSSSTVNALVHGRGNPSLDSIGGVGFALGLRFTFRMRRKTARLVAEVTT